MKSKFQEKSLINIGLIGVGRWGKNIVKTSIQIPNLSITCVASKNRKTKELVPNDCKIFSDWRDLISYPQLNGVIICTPPNTHFAIAKSLINAEYPTLVEKPITLNYEEAKIINELSESKKCLVMNDLTQLFNYKFLALKNSLSLVGDIKFIITRSGNFGPYRKDTSVLWDWGTHDLSTLISLMGMYPKEITSKKIKENPRRDGDESLWNINCSFDNEIKSNTLIGNMMPKCRKIGVLGTKGMLVFDDWSTTPLTFYKNWKSKELPLKEGLSIKIQPNKKPLYLVLETFSNLIKNNIKKHWSIEMSVEISRLLSKC